MTIWIGSCNNLMTDYLKAAAQDFWRNPLLEIVLTLFFLLFVITGIFLGPAAIAYFWHHNPSAPPPPARTLLLGQRFSGSQRLRTCLVLGWVLWLLVLYPVWSGSICWGLAWWVIMQPFWVMMLIADRYDLNLTVTLKATCVFATSAPRKAGMLLLLGLLGYAGTLLGIIGIVVTLPIAVNASLRLLEDCHLELAGAVQRVS